MDDYLIEISDHADDADVAGIKAYWQTLSQNQILPYFMTWSWIAPWIETYHPQITLVTVRYNDQVVAIGILTRSVEKRHYFVKARQLRLHQMGDPLQDQIWMEYNDFLALPEHQESATNACLKALQQLDGHDEIVISMARQHRAQAIKNNLDYVCIGTPRPCYALNLQTIRELDQPYLLTLKSNTRYQIRRSIRHYEKLHGELSIKIANNAPEALEYFREAGPLHIERWDDSGYHNPEFIRFHETLIESNLSSGSVVLMKILSGNVTIGIIYFHIVGKSVYFYLHGLLYESDAKLKPGLVAHALATQYFIDQGMDYYDYMGGYSQYKIQLAEHSEDLTTVVIQKPSFKFKLEELGSRIKHLFAGKRDN